MPLLYKRKTDRGAADDVLDRAAALVRQGASVRSAAIDFGVDRCTLRRYIIKKRENPNAVVGYKNCKLKNMVFPIELEVALSDHIKMLSRMFFGLSKEKTLKLAYNFARANMIETPKSWMQNEKAGDAFWQSFKARNRLSIRTPEATSIARASAFNRHNVTKFFNNLADVLSKDNFDPNDIYNLDETGVHTVQEPGKVVTQRGLKQVGSITPAERGELVTLLYTISASGVVLPPMFIFPRVNYRDHFIKGAPNGSLGKARSTGWISEELFLEYIDFLAEKTRCSIDKKILVILDNHESHISLDVIDKSKEKGVILLTIPPHTSHKLQPLDRTCYKSFKQAYNLAFDNFMRTNPGKKVTIYDIPDLVNSAHSYAFTHANIVSGFKNTGIYPYNSNIFTDLDFAPSDVTDRQDPAFAEASERYVFSLDEDDVETVLTTNENTPACSSSGLITACPSTSDTACSSSSLITTSPSPNGTTCSSSGLIATSPSTSGTACSSSGLIIGNSSTSGTACSSSDSVTTSSNTSGTSGSSNNDTVSTISSSDVPKAIARTVSTSITLTSPGYVPPEAIAPIPKAGPRKNTTTKRKKGATQILTDTPTRNAIAADKEERLHRKKPRAKRSIFTATQLSSDSEDDMDINELCALQNYGESSEEEDLSKVVLTEVSPQQVSVGDYLIYQYLTKKQKKYYIAKVIEEVDEDDELQVEFYKRGKQIDSFVVSGEEATISIFDVKYILPQPKSAGTTSRTKGMLIFEINFGDLNIM